MKNRVFIIVAGIVAAVIWSVWLQTKGFEYIRLDDNDYTFECPFVAEGFSLSNVKSALKDLTHGGIWMPVTSITYMADISLFGAGPQGHHLASVGWHFVNAILFLLFLLKLTARWSRDDEVRRVIFCGFATLFWAVHPLRNESVAWIASRKDLVFMFWLLVGLLAWLRGNATGVIIGWVCCALSCMSKPTAMVFPFIALFSEMLSHETCATFRERIRSVRWCKYIPLLLMAIATGALAMYSQTHVPTGEGPRGIYEGYGTFSWRCFNALVALGLYVAQTIVPVGVHVVYRAMTDSVPQGALIGTLVFFGLFIVLAIPLIIKIKNKGSIPWVLYLCVAWFIVAIGPTLGIAGGFGDHARADRFLYLPAMGFSVAIIWGLMKVKISVVRMALILSAVSVIYGVATWYNAKTYKTDYTLFKQAVDWDPNHPMALAHVGTELCARLGKVDEGIECYRRAIKEDPTAEDTVAQLVFALATRGNVADFGEIKKLCENLSANPALDDKGMASEALGMVLMREQKWDEAIACFSASIGAERRNTSPEAAMIQLAMCYFNKKDLKNAEKIFDQLARYAENPTIKARARQSLQIMWMQRQNAK